MKKMLALILTLTLIASLFAGCGASEKKDDGVFNVAIVQQLDHSSLDEIRVFLEVQTKHRGVQYLRRGYILQTVAENCIHNYHRTKSPESASADSGLFAYYPPFGRH